MIDGFSRDVLADSVGHTKDSMFAYHCGACDGSAAYAATAVHGTLITVSLILHSVRGGVGRGTARKDPR